ncbi:MAG: carboxypeptidase-like regulatory domain-containing protein [Nitrososphaerota archaeon]
MSNKIGRYSISLVLAALLIAATAAVAISVIPSPSTAQAKYEIWMKLVTTQWKGDTTNPVFPDPANTTLPGRYNLTDRWYFVEVFHQRGAPYNDVLYGGIFRPNGTGFVKVSWPKTWDNATIVVKAKTYDGTELGRGSLGEGIIVYALYVNIKGNNTTGLNYTGNDLDMAAWVANFSKPENALLAKAAVAFKRFHVHTWYDLKDNLSYAQVKIYDINHTAASDSKSLLRAFITKGDGSGNSLYDPAATGELYPADSKTIKDNEWVPIPLQVMRLNRTDPYYTVPLANLGRQPNLNATVRVWWETVLVNTTLFIRPEGRNDLPGPFNITAGTFNLNSTVFYFRCAVRDSDPQVNGIVYPNNVDVKSALFDASCKVNLRDRNGAPYHFMHELGKTNELYNNSYAASTNPHAWPGYLSEYRNYLRVPNATMWWDLFLKFKEIAIVDGAGRVYNASAEVYVSKYYTGTDDLRYDDPRRIALNDYLYTMTVSDDPGPYRGFRMEVQYAGGFRNAYGGREISVNVTLVNSPYDYSLRKPNWITNRVNGTIFVTARVADIVFIITDQEGNILHPDFTEAYLLRDNGPPVKLAFFQYVSTDNNGKHIYEYYGRVSWPFLYQVVIDPALVGFPSVPPKFIAVAYQVPMELMYGIVVNYQGVRIYTDTAAVPKLVRSEAVTVNATIFRVKLLFVDCRDRPLTDTPVWVYDPTLQMEVKLLTGPDGGIDFVMPTQALRFTRLYWKGVDVRFVNYKLPDGTVISAAANGSVTIAVDRSFREPIKITAMIDDIIFRTTDFAGITGIPDLNITISWVGYNITRPGEPWYFLQTMDPGPYAVIDNELAVRLGLPDDFDTGRNDYNTSVRVAQFFSYVIFHRGDTNEYIFYQMPATTYNITVTTVVSKEYTYRTPGEKYWPGRDVAVPYESVISWSPGSESMLPEEVHEPATINSRVVLRLFNYPIVYTACGATAIQLRTWALTWNLDMVDGGLRIGDASFDVVNDNGRSIREITGYYNVSKWDDVLRYRTVVYAAEKWKPYSFIWWNGSYMLRDLSLETNLTFTVNMFYNESALPNKVWPVLNFTLQPSEELFRGTAVYANWTEIQKNFEVKRPALRNKVIIYDGETLIAPLPVTFIKPRAVAKGGEPLANARIELWILDLDVNETRAVKISAADSGNGTLLLPNKPDADNISISWRWEMKWVESATPQVFERVRWDRITITCPDGREYYLQVPPSPAKLLIRNFCGKGVAVAISSDYIYPVVREVKFANFTTNEQGEIDSFTLPAYSGYLMVPTSGYLNATMGVKARNITEEFHYRFNVIWRDAVVYSDNFVLTKEPVTFGASEVYSGRFMFTLSNATDPAYAVRGLNLTIFYPNVTTYDWADNKFENITIISGVDADGVVEFTLLPGPRFMNTTYKYFFAANHSAIGWLENLVATQLVLNNETFGDGPLKAVTRTRIDVPIMLNAAREVMFIALAWRDEAGIATAYPIPNYRIRYAIRNLDAGIVAAEGEATTTADGVVRVESGRDPTRVFWAGMTIRYRVEPPDPTMTHAFYPDEEPTHWAISRINGTSINPITGRCSGICVLNARCKPYLITIDYTAITVRVTDVNGRPVVGARVDLIDKATMKLASWSVTVDRSWEARPIEWVALRDKHAIEYQTRARVIGGAGSTRLMNVSIGPVAYDATDDDVIDYSIPSRGISEFITYIVRVYYSPPGEVKDGLLYQKAEGRRAKVYDSTEDEITWKTMQPRYMSGARIWTPLPTQTEPGALPKEHVDVSAKIMDISFKFGYAGKELPEKVARDVTATLEGQGVKITTTGAGLNAVGLIPGTYTLEVKAKGITVGRESIQLTNTNVDRMVSLALKDVIVEAVDLLGRPVTGFAVSVEGPYYAEITTPKDNKATIVAAVAHEFYTITASVERYGVRTASTYMGVPEDRIRLMLPIGDVKITVVDVYGNPVGAATVKLGTVETKTDAQGTAIFSGVPLETEVGAPVRYDVVVERETTVRTTITTSRTTTEFRILFGLGDIKVIVRGAAGQPLAGARVDVLKAGALVGTAVTDDKGEAVFRGLPEGTYTVRVDWKTFKDEKTVTLSEAEIMAKVPKTVEFALPPFTEIAGVPLDFGTFVALIVGIILLVIVLAIIISEYVRWRGRRLGIYPPPPPKK